MSRSFWLNFAVFAAFLAAIILSILGLTQGIPALAVVALVLAALAVVGYNYLVVNPMLLENAKQSARELCEAGQIVDPGLHDKLCSRLAKAPADAEAVELHRKLTDLKANGETPPAPGES
jgi:hypothetical protein